MATIINYNYKMQYYYLIFRCILIRWIHFFSIAVEIIDKISWYKLDTIYISKIVLLIILEFDHSKCLKCIISIIYTERITHRNIVQPFAGVAAEWAEYSTTPGRVFLSLLIIILASTTDRNTIFLYFFISYKKPKPKKKKKKYINEWMTYSF